ncbi:MULTISPECIES: peptidoglycan binding domain-containing protein [Streptomyces]|uniref:Membrane protein n=2 Tax=Streptomyces TaxID=1883 RepID=A0A380MTV7_STRGR|nr:MULTISPECIES: hypothetical protein [Streptomyces]WSU35840.1 hypothetical protein OG378_08545 [Streptomyces gougerotii]SUO94777.1 Membrane protein [Streptomyces griseus]GFH63603.1 hypothetical protein Srut_01170 [Streptomyces rutgersensis]GFH74767.1 hypothetical protein Sdia_55350 [Streptomyces diastaticus subsp. diastaticus]GGU05225.1 hypothetical protein GCM10015534_04040 [Streptomyces diastaticus subsp. diastaticus]
MSRETDSSSSGPQGRDNTAYPSGTPPYGASAAGGADERGPAAADRGDAERKTETTLTTRIRINIPGSRPIPPVVMRTPVAEKDADAETGETAAPAPAAERSGPSARGGGERPGGNPGAEAPAEEAPRAAEKPTSDWFAPRKSAGRPAATGGGAGQSGGTPASAGPAGAAAGGPGGPGAGKRPGGSGQASYGSGATGDTGPTGTPGRNGTTGSFDVSRAVAQGPLGPGPARPDGPTGGPVSGDSTVRPVLSDGGRAPGGQGDTGGVPRVGDTGSPPRPGGPRGPAGPMSDDTAVLTPQKPAPERPAEREHVSGDTLTSGLPVVPPGPAADAPGGPFGPGGPGGPGAHRDGPLPHTPPRLPEPLGEPEPETSRPAKRKGRNKLVLLGAAVVVVGAGLYGAGLLMGHADVPKGTTVLGVDIGGSTHDEAVKKLDAAFGERTALPLALDVDGKQAELKPAQAGLSLDSEATARSAAASDYNPVTVVGSLFGQERVVEPTMPVDKEKLADALDRLAGTAGSAVEGSISFKSGEPVPVYGKAGKTLDVKGSVNAVEQAYRTQVASGESAPVAVPMATREPTVSKTEVDRMMKEFAVPAMSGIVTVKAGEASIPFGPERSLPQILSVQAVDGKLVEKYDQAALKKLYGNTFDGIMITRGTGDRTPVTPEDVIGAMRQALLGTTPEERVGVIETDAS